MKNVPKNTFVFLGAAIGWFAVVVQFVLMVQNRVESLAETTVRFFSFFTILTSCLVTLYFTVLWLKKPIFLLKSFQKNGFLTAITLYITVVGLVYQVLLRGLWEPTGMQRLVDELLHSVIPLYVIVFWFVYENKKEIPWKAIPVWLVYPLAYLIYTLLRGYVSGFYPYPFLDVSTLGLENVIRNSSLLVLLFTGLAVLLVSLGKFQKKN